MSDCNNTYDATTASNEVSIIAGPSSEIVDDVDVTNLSGTSSNITRNIDIAAKPGTTSDATKTVVQSMDTSTAQKPQISPSSTISSNSTTKVWPISSTPVKRKGSDCDTEYTRPKITKKQIKPTPTTPNSSTGTSGKTGNKDMRSFFIKTSEEKRLITAKWAQFFYSTR